MVTKIEKRLDEAAKGDWIGRSHERKREMGEDWGTGLGVIGVCALFPRRERTGGDSPDGRRRGREGEERGEGGKRGRDGTRTDNICRASACILP